MHLDTITQDLQVGDHVDGGQQIGTLGASAIRHAAPHCHFQLEIPLEPDTRGDTVNTRFVDPAPYLVRASIARAPDRRHAIKPAL
jgi:murein DD-endopeptidase MepM/ murein hydrolase activator NlpD